jgi:hypothetical protein
LVRGGVQWGGEWAGYPCGDVEAGHCSQNENNSDFEERREKLPSPEEGPAMDIKSQDPANATGLAAESERQRPRAAAWFWKPWYAKAWWALGGLYWGGKILSCWSGTLDRLYMTAAAGYLNILFFPVAPVLVLGIGFVLAWLAYCSSRISEGCGEELPSSIVGSRRRNPYSDPLNPKSGSLWLGHPSNIAKQFGRHWP